MPCPEREGKDKQANSSWPGSMSGAKWPHSTAMILLIKLFLNAQMRDFAGRPEADSALPVQGTWVPSLFTSINKIKDLHVAIKIKDPTWYRQINIKSKKSLKKREILRRKTPENLVLCVPLRGKLIIEIQDPSWEAHWKDGDEKCGRGWRRRAQPRLAWSALEMVVGPVGIIILELVAAAATAKNHFLLS